MSEVATRGPKRPVDYESAQEAQRALVEKRRMGLVPDLLWILEHPATITWGSAGGKNHLLATEKAIAERGIRLLPSERGGDVTCHEPGQLVGYLVVDLRGPGDRDMHVFLRAVEEGLMRTLGSFGLDCRRIDGRTGVWLAGEPTRKIAALGVRAKGWITSHGFALNVHNSLEGFRLIVPCGVADAGVTSMARELAVGKRPGWEALGARLHEEMQLALARPLQVLWGDEGLGAVGGVAPGL